MLLTETFLRLRGPALVGAGLLVLATPLAAQPLQLQPGTATPARTARPAAPRPIPLPPIRPADLGAPRAATAAPTAAAVQTASNEPARPAVTPVRTAPAGAPATQEEAIERLNAYLNSFTTLQGNFTQVGANGRRLQGKLYIQRPGKMRFEYAPPTTTEVVADGTSVAIRDKKLATQDVYSIGQTPLKFLVRERMDLNRDATMTGASVNGDTLSVRLEDRSTLGGTSKITLNFDLAANELRQWIVVDPQGYETSVSLSNLDTQRRPDPKNFVIDYQRTL